MARGLPFGSDERIAVFRSLFAKLPLFEPYECHDPMREIAPGSWLLFERVAFGGRVPRLYETISLGGNIDDFDEVAKLLGVDKSFVYAQCEWKDDGPLPASPRVSDDLGTAMALVSTIFALIWSRLRCDHEVVFDAFGLLLDVAPSAALALLRAALDKTYDASVWTHVLEVLHPDAWLPREDIHLRERDAILLRLLDNHRYDGSPRRRGSHFKHCRSPADAAAHLLGLSTHVPFDCHASDAKQHAAIREIQKRMKAASSR